MINIDEVNNTVELKQNSLSVFFTRIISIIVFTILLRVFLGKNTAMIGLMLMIAGALLGFFITRILRYQYAQFDVNNQRLVLRKKFLWITIKEKNFEAVLPHELIISEFQNKGKKYNLRLENHNRLFPVWRFSNKSEAMTMKDYLEKLISLDPASENKQIYEPIEAMDIPGSAAELRDDLAGLYDKFFKSSSKD